MLLLEVDALSRPQVLALLEDHLRDRCELSPPDKVFASDAGKLQASGVTFLDGMGTVRSFWATGPQELSPTEGEIESMRTPSALRRTGAERRFTICGPFGSYRENGNSVFHVVASGVASSATH